jgi:hypothetical protein
MKTSDTPRTDRFLAAMKDGPALSWKDAYIRLEQWARGLERECASYELNAAPQGAPQQDCDPSGKANCAPGRAGTPADAAHDGPDGRASYRTEMRLLSMMYEALSMYQERSTATVGSSR